MDKERLSQRSVDSTKSEYRTEYGRFTGPFLADRTSRATDNMVVAYGEYLFDAVSIILIDRSTNSVALAPISEVKNKNWYPTIPVRYGQGHIEAAQEYLYNLLKHVKNPSDKPIVRGQVFTEPQFANCYRVQVPGLQEFVQRILYNVDLKPEFSADSFNPESLPLGWYPIKSLTSESVWSNEVLHCDSAKLNPIHELTVAQIVEQFTGDDEASKFLMAIGGDERALTRIYTDFVQLTYPAQTMNFLSFSLYMKAMRLLQTTDSIMLGFFHAMCPSKHNCLPLRDLINGLLVCDPRTPHGGFLGEQRVDCIFRFYSNNTDYLTPVNINQFAFDLLKSRSQDTLTEEMIAAEVRTIYKALKLSPNENVTKPPFLTTIRNMGIRGTSALYRIKTHPFELCQGAGIFADIQLIQLNSNKATSALGVKLSNAKGTCFRCREKKYGLCIHYVKILQDGMIVDPQILMMTNNMIAKIPRTLRKMSLTLFDGTHLLNTMLEIIREAGETRSFLHVFAAKFPKTDILEMMAQICRGAEDLFKSEQRVVKLNSPVYVFGDIHGNLHDLLVMEKILWRSGPSTLNANYLFLGDYVDRGGFSIECALYLMCYKMLQPHRFIMLRGNHELRSVQKQFTFELECRDKFKGRGDIVFNMFNSVFDCMPPCCVIDEQIFCSHGGIPMSVQRLDLLQSVIPKVLSDPEHQCPPVWEMLWDDPINSTETEECKMMAIEDLKRDPSPRYYAPGYYRNHKRGTAYFFNEVAVNNFLELNKLSHIIRGHECPTPGFSMHCEGKVITIFSSSGYCGLLNDAACILIDDEKLRIIKIETKT